MTGGVCVEDMRASQAFLIKWFSKGDQRGNRVVSK